jgi:uncharacterized protein (TIGR03437 family)
LQVSIHTRISKPLALLLLALAAVSTCNAQTSYTISTVAGSANSGDGGPATSGILSQPEGIALDGRGNIYIADANDHRIRKVASDGTIRTIAGTGIAGFNGDDGPAEAAQLNAPYGLCTDRNGNLFVADLGNSRVRKISPDGKITTAAGGGLVLPGGDGDGGPATSAKLLAPRNVAVDPQGNLYISDFQGHRVFKVDLSGTLTTVAGSGTSGSSGDGASALLATLSYPAGIAVDRLGVLYIADTGSKKIRRVYQGVISTVLGATPIQLNVPTGLAVDRLDNLYIADNRSVMIRVSQQGAVSTIPVGGGDVAVDALDNVYTTGSHLVKRLTGAFVSTIAGTGNSGFSGDGANAATARLDTPAGLARDTSGNWYIADSRNLRVRRINPQGIIGTFAGAGPTAPSPGTQATSVRLSLPSSVAVDTFGNVYFSDTSANRIRRVASDGAISTIAGADEPGMRGDDGPAARAILNNPTGIAFDGENNLYIADTGNNRIRKITASGQISTVAGGGATTADKSAALEAKLIQPTAVATDRNGNVYIAETGGNKIRLLTRAGVLTTLAGSRLNLQQPRGLRFSETGDIVFADSGSNTIRRLSLNGELVTIAGTGAAGFAGDGGPANAARLYGPSDLAFDIDGSIWISDTGNNRIRKLTPAAAQPLTPPATLTTISVTHGASLLDLPVAPGEIISIFGTGLGPDLGAIGRVTSARTLETAVAGTQVLFDGIPAPLFFVQDKQINAQVPYTMTGRLESEVTVLVGGVLRGRVRVQVKEAVPGLLTVAAGAGQAVVINEDGISNGPGHPAQRGSVVTLYATGDGQLGPDAIDGKPYGAAKTSYSVTVDFGGYSGEVLYAGRAPGYIGLMQINVRIPSQYVPSGDVPLVLTVHGETSQNGVTLAIR